MNTTVTTAERVIFQSNRFDPTIKVVNMMTNPASKDDAMHFIAYGYTMGSAIHHARRSSNWNELSANAYNQACNNPNLRAFRAADGKQVAVLGYNYMTIFQAGEYQKKVVSYGTIDRISLLGNEVRLWARNSNNNYSYVSFNNMIEGAEQLVKCLKYYMKKYTQKHATNNVATKNEIAPVVNSTPASVPAPNKNPMVVPIILFIAGIIIFAIFALGVVVPGMSENQREMHRMQQEYVAAQNRYNEYVSTWG